MTFEQLMEANRARQAEWSGDEAITVEFRALEVAGEAGEVAEAVKKYIRRRDNIGGSISTRQDIADEIGDVVIACALLADELDLDFGRAVAAKFNRTSEKYGLETRIEI